MTFVMTFILKRNELCIHISTIFMLVRNCIDIFEGIIYIIFLSVNACTKNKKMYVNFISLKVLLPNNLNGGLYSLHYCRK